MTLTLIRLPDAAKRLGLPTSSFYELMGNGLIPPPIHLGKRRVAWIEQEIDAVVAAHIRAETEPEIRSLVNELIKSRKNAGLGLAA